jgi:2'-hydroxyisoflavone reductase
MKVLILGGTLFLGRHLVEAALARGHEVTLFNRGRTNPELFPEVEKLRGDRDSGDLSALEGRSWDAVVDPSARVPRWVRDLADIAGDRIGHYSLLSSCSVYSDTSKPGIGESAPVHTIADATTEEITSAETYGALKALCEQAAEELLPGRALSVRAGLIVGPHDDSGRFTYWVHRIARGGDVLAPEPPDQPVQLIHARDLADWILAKAEEGQTGVFNATGPETPLTLEALLEECRSATTSDARLTWVDGGFLVESGVEAWSDLPLWLGTDPAVQGFLSVDISKALAAGLRFRPLADTIRDTLAKAHTTPEAGLNPERERELLLA